MKYICKICGYVYDDSKEKIPFNKLPDDWRCPLCGASKSDFEQMIDNSTTNPEIEHDIDNANIEHSDNFEELSYQALSSVCSNLARGCEKQYLEQEAEMYRTLANYFSKLSKPEKQANFDNLVNLVMTDLNENYPKANKIASEDRGALRALTWSEKVSNMLKSLLTRYQNEGEKMLDHTNVWICTICGFIYIGENPPTICPVCKVQSNKFVKIEGGAN